MAHHRATAAAPSAQLALRMALLAPAPGASDDRPSEWAPATPPPPGQNDPLADLPAPPTIPGLPDPDTLPPPLPTAALPGAANPATPLLRDFPSLVYWGGLLALTTAGGGTTGVQASATMALQLVHGLVAPQAGGTSGSTVLGRDLAPIAQAISGATPPATLVSTLPQDDPRVVQARALWQQPRGR